jgi:phospholipase C
MNESTKNNPLRVPKEGSTAGLFLSRRTFLKKTGTAAAGLSFGLALSSSAKPLPMAKKTGIQHIVLVMMENRSFDHFLGWLPGAAGQQAGLSYPDKSGVAHSTFPLAPDYQGCRYADPDHTYEGARIQYDNGACDGWLRAGTDDLFPIGYYVKNDLAFLGNAAPAWTTCDHYFSAIMAPTYPNRIYQHAAQTDRLDDSLLPLSTLPTIWDRLAEGGIDGRYYYSDFPILAFWGPKYVSISEPITNFFADCAAGTLPHVSYVDPRFQGEEEGISGDDHPHGDIRDGEAFLNSIYQAVTTSPNWRHTVLVINFDEWGGFFDHVPPAIAPIPTTDAALGSDGRRGFRVPALVISPWSPRGRVASGVYDHTSILKMIEWRWGLRPLTVRDANANNLADVLNFDQLNLTAPQFSVPTGPFGTLCGLSEAGVNRAELLQQYARSFGFAVQ